MENNILIVDIETTGFNTATDFIVEIGIVSLNIITGDITNLVDEVVWEEGITREICENSWICNNSTLTADAIRFGNNLHKIKNLIQCIINHYPLGITAFNNDFDFRFLESRDIDLPNKLDCPMKLLTDIMKLNHRKRAGYKYPSVTEVYNYLFPNREYTERHRGLSDAIDESEIIYELIKRGIFKVDI